jgi:hypothetical protein
MKSKMLNNQEIIRMGKIIRYDGRDLLDRILQLSDESGRMRIGQYIEDDLLQFCVETIDGKDVVEVGVGFEDMTRFVNLHRSPVSAKRK